MKRPVWILHLFVVGLAVHNFAMAELYAAGIRGSALELVSAWKEALLALGLVLVLREHGSLRFRPAAVDWLAIAYGAFVVVYGLIPQHWLGGGATHKGVLLGVRHDLLPVATYFFGRGLKLTVRDARYLGVTVLSTGVALATFGLVDIYTIPLSWWRSSGAPDWYRYQLGFKDPGLSNLPENFVYNTGNEHPLRRLVSTFLSPLASSYLLVTALLLATTWLLRLRPRLTVWLPTTALLYAGLLWTHSRSSYLALSLGLLVFAAAAATVAHRAGRRGAPLGGRRLRVREGLPADRAGRELHGGRAEGAAADGARGGRRPRRRRQRGRGREHLASTSRASAPASRRSSTTRRATGPATPARPRPAPASRSRRASRPTPSSASTPGSWAGCCSSPGRWRCSGGWCAATAWLGAAMVAMLALGLQTDIIGVPWLVYLLWPLAGWRVSQREP